MKNLSSSKLKGKRLGRGLDVLLGPASYKNEVLLLDIEKIVPNKNQPRKNFEKQALLELSQSIKENGILQAILVKKTEEGYQIIAGERRWRAAGLAGLKKIPAVSKAESTKKEMDLWALVENLQREDLNPMEQAQALQKIMAEGSWSQETLAKYLGISRPSLANSLRLLNLDPEVQQLVWDKKLSFSQARELLRFKDPKKQREMAMACLKQSLPVIKITKNKNKKPNLPCWVRKNLTEIEKKWNQTLKLKYSKGKGFLSFSFKSEEELKKLLDQFLSK